MAKRQGSGSNYGRPSKANVLIFTIAVTAFLAGAIAYFALGYVRQLGQYNQQVNAIDAAALAAASDVGRIVVTDPNWGYVSLSDYPPVHRGTVAGDNWFLPVHSINTIFATVRLDMIIADKLNDPTMKACARRDYVNAMGAKDAVNNALDNLATGGNGVDIDGNVINPLADATAAYNKSRINMVGNSNLVAGSMKMTFGVVRGRPTLTPIPTPTKYAELTTDQQINGMYKAYTNIIYNDKSFVFAAVGSNATLVDHKNFEVTADDLPYIIKTVVKVEADQQTTDNSGNSSIQHAVACAIPAGTSDRRPKPGSLVLMFPKGAPPDLGSLYGILTNTTFASSPSDVLRTPPAGDYPQSPLTRLKIDIGPYNPGAPIGQICRLSMYDWIRNAGAGLNIDSLVAAINAPIAADTSTHRLWYDIDVNGNISQRSEACSPSPTLPCSQRQMYGISGLAFNSSDGNRYDIFVRDFCYHLGPANGGMHAGEPIMCPWGPPIAGAIGLGWPETGIREKTDTMGSFILGPAGGGNRPTYLAGGICTEWKFKPRWPSFSDLYEVNDYSRYVNAGDGDGGGGGGDGGGGGGDGGGGGGA